CSRASTICARQEPGTSRNRPSPRRSAPTAVSAATSNSTFRTTASSKPPPPSTTTSRRATSASRGGSAGSSSTTATKFPQKIPPTSAEATQPPGAEENPMLSRGLLYLL